MLVLSGDVGGTRTRLQLTRFATKTEFQVLAEHEFSNHEYESFPQIVMLFLKGRSLESENIKSV